MCRSSTGKGTREAHTRIGSARLGSARLGQAQETGRARVGNEQSNYQSVASETIFLLRFLPPPCASARPRLVKLLAHTHTHIDKVFPSFALLPPSIHRSARLQNADHGFTVKTGKYGFVNLTR